MSAYLVDSDGSAQGWADRSEFIAAALRVTGDGYRATPFDEDLAIFEETGRALLEYMAEAPDEDFDGFCMEHVDAPAAIVLPFLFKLRDKDADA